ncbi:MAG: phenylalanine--tRNA ligase subunit beta [Desulfomonile tiedjei]|nr:phenylalanine--tRNA ligase subunit beta [Desulfomonile tiedjei]
MLVSYNWLKEFVEIDQSAEEIAELLTMAGIEVEAVNHVGRGLDKVVTAKIEGITPHPASEKMSLARISLGSREIEVVCAAPNIRVGQIVPYAGPGTVLPSGLEIAEREIKGISSPGMLCSEKELDLGDDASGILVLEEGVKTGVPLPDALPFIEDTMLEISVTPNRGDCLSVLGIAREVGALTDRPWKIPDFPLEEGPVKIQDRASIEVPDYDLCPRYVARMVEGVTIKASPFDIRLRLSRCGIRPISNVVDATNLICLECGQPLHAFDYSFLQDAKIVVRRCDAGETFVTLDGVERKLPENALMIRDGRKSVALAGIMGGLNSEIKDDTSSVLVESACFERFGIRRTAKALGMSTEASFRMERGVDPEGSLWAAHRVAYLIHRLAGGTILAGHLDVYHVPIARPKVLLRVDKANELLGTDLSSKQMSGYLQRLGLNVEAEGTPNLQAIPPSWRWDLEREVDLAEEVARVHGFQNIPLSMPSYQSAPDRTGQHQERIRRAAELMNASGYTEVVTMSFVSKEAAKEFATRDPAGATLDLINPLSEDYAVMRTSLIPGLLASMKRNVNFRWEDLKLYELGKVFALIPGQELPREDLVLAGLATGARHAELWNVSREDELDFYDVKGALENLCAGLGVSEPTFVPSKIPFLHPGKSADLVLSGATIGFVGELAPSKMRDHDLARKVHIFEILLEPLFIQSRKERVFSPLPRYPYIERDLSIIVERNCSGDNIKHLISHLGHDIIASVILFDLYQGESIPEGRQSMAFRIRYQSEDRTLTDEEVQEVHDGIVQALINDLGATMRE